MKVECPFCGDNNITYVPDSTAVCPYCRLDVKLPAPERLPADYQNTWRREQQAIRSKQEKEEKAQQDKQAQEKARQMRERLEKARQEALQKQQEPVAFEDATTQEPPVVSPPSLAIVGGSRRQAGFMDTCIDFLDLRFKRYLTPVLLRVCWVLAIVFVLLLVPYVAVTLLEKPEPIYEEFSSVQADISEISSLLILREASRKDQEEKEREEIAEKVEREFEERRKREKEMNDLIAKSVRGDSAAEMRLQQMIAEDAAKSQAQLAEKDAKDARWAAEEARQADVWRRQDENRVREREELIRSSKYKDHSDAQLLAEKLKLEATLPEPVGYDYAPVTQSVIRIVLATIALLVSLIAVRIFCEFLIVIFNAAKDLRDIRSAMTSV